MSVRRLADEAVQPASFAFTPENLEWAYKTIAKYPEGRQQSAVIPLLMRAQEQDGWVTRPAIEHVSQMLDMPLIRVLEVATFYTQFQLAPVGTRAHIQVCGTTPCMLRGAGELIEMCKHKIHPEPFHLNEEGTLSWEEVECQGACVNAPMVMIFKDAYEDLTTERLEEIIDAFEAGKGDTIVPGPQIDRFTSAPTGGFTSLNDESAVIRVKQPKSAGRTKHASSGSAVPPSDAARPRTDAIETNAGIASPSPVKVKSEKEAAISVAPPSEEDRPSGIKRPAQPDDLQLIAGVGPKSEEILHSLGIYTYLQIAAWSPQEQAWVDHHLRFSGRIDREEWVKQAEVLARGGAAEYERVFGKKPR